MIELRHYQKSGVDAIRMAFGQGIKRVCYTLPTGGGKTCLFSFITARMAENRKLVCILVHREELVEQVSAALTEQGVHHGIIKAGYVPSPDARVQVASVYSLCRRLCQHREFDLIIADECHHAVAGSWATIMKAYPEAFLLGVTATPVRLDGKGLAHAFDKLIVGPSTQDLIDGGYLVPPIVYAPSQIDFSTLRQRAGDFARDDAAQLMDTAVLYGDAIKHYRRLAHGMPFVGFCCTVELTKKTADQFTAAGIPCMAIDGTLDRDERRHRIDMLRTGRIYGLMSCDLISEGFDLPGIHAALLLRPTQSLSLFLQQIGRALRPAHGKTHAVILDHAGNCHRHGLPTDGRCWELTMDRPKKKGVELSTCLACYAVYSRFESFCPVCGVKSSAMSQGGKSDPRKVDAELQKIDNASPWATLPFKEAIRKARTERDLRDLAAARGYKPGWVHYMMQQRRLLPGRAK